MMDDLRVIATTVRPFTEVLAPYVWPFLVSAVVTMLVMPIVRAVASTAQIYDLPDRDLKPHERPIPYLGGVGIYLGWAAALLCASILFEGSGKMLTTILVAGTIMMLTGLVDDIFDIRPRTKLILQLVAAGVLIAGGIGNKVANVVLVYLPFSTPEWIVFPLSALATVVILMGAGNATNLIDGLDGLCSGVIGIISLGFLGIATHLAMHGHSPTGDPVRLAVSVALFGACLVFLRYNFNPAQIFMGDAGSLLLGFNAAVMILLFTERDIPRWFIGALMVFALPIFDTALAIARRWVNKKPLFTGDRSHFYDQLRQRGLSVRRTVLISYALATFYAAVGCLVVFIRARYAIIVFGLVLLATVMAVIRLGMLRRDK
jgi:UDP-GlcNAc:undecaprenyl-phosphate GlcNAc-1-phosphate transferase